MTSSSAPSVFRLSDVQDDFVHDEHRYALFLGGIGAGKSHAGAVKPLVQEFGRGPQLGLVIAPTYPMLRDATWRTALDLWQPLVEQIVRNEMRIVLRGGIEVLFRSADEPDRLRGPNVSWCWIDEAAQCHPDTWLIAIGRLRQHGRAGRAWLTTTPRGTNWVYDVFVRRADSETTVFRATTWANPFVDRAFVESLTSQYEGEFARQELAAEWVTSLEGALLEWRWLEDARNRVAPYDPRGGPLVAGVDVAGPGESETVVYLRQGRAVLDMQAFSDADARGPVLAMLRPWRHKGLKVVNYDSAGAGIYFGPHLKDEMPGVRIRDVNVGERPTTDEARERFANLKAELYWALRERFADGDVAGLTDQTTITQLSDVRYEHDSRGRVEIESKDTARKRGVKSPDRAEALMLAFAPEGPNAGLADLYRRSLDLVVRG